MPDTSCSIIVHGGAWEIPDSATEDCKAGCRRALEAGWKILQGGGRAVEAVEAAIVVLEDDPVFDAGYGSHLNREGRVQLDAIIMDGRTLDAGSVAAVERVKNPIRLARRVMERSAHILLVGEGAEQFAEENGIPLCRNEELICPRERESWQRCIQSQHDITRHFPPHVASHGTVGAVARDSQGDIVAATSTGGTCCKLPGRVGDSPLIGCGAYADIEAGGVSCTGYGEAIMRIVMAKTAVDMMHPLVVNASARGLRTSTRGEPLAGYSAVTAQHAAEESVRLLAERGRGTGGLILLDRTGRPGFAFSTPHMAYGYVAEDGSFVVGV